MRAQELQELSYIGFSISIICALLIFPPFSPLEWSLRCIVLQACIMSASVTLLIMRLDLFIIRAILTIIFIFLSLLALILVDVLSVYVPIYSIAIAALPRASTPCRKTSVLGEACLIAAKCTNKKNFMIVRGPESRNLVEATIRALPLYNDGETNAIIKIARVGLDEYLIVSGTQSVGGLYEYDYPALACSSIPDFNPLF